MRYNPGADGAPSSLGILIRLVPHIAPTVALSAGLPFPETPFHDAVPPRLAPSVN